MRVSLTEFGDWHQVRRWTSGNIPADRFGDVDIVVADEHRKKIRVREFERRYERWDNVPIVRLGLERNDQAPQRRLVGETPRMVRMLVVDGPSSIRGMVGRFQEAADAVEDDPTCPVMGEIQHRSLYGLSAKNNVMIACTGVIENDAAKAPNDGIERSKLLRPCKGSRFAEETQTFCVVPLAEDAEVGVQPFG